ncbi:hypothetical protein STBHUCCB_32190 [Salmonella enterica subsp. enterica serovar Typhi str. P-stx-12]|nr:hypothetical protein STBHUCCB_32190 [Salmonella enterica subsp. enterica serovar Typhi str. P-stx-12]AXR56574.1 hypothetical protein CJP42_4304 [Salmonella enterica subsp. enterica serovar Typhi]EDX52039.1 hypothetical protein SNSL317_A3871 [Salmonella enterica subsp. enterica serovar Newport str. SL317]
MSIRKGDYPGTYKIFFISVKTLINENSLFFDLNHFLCSQENKQIKFIM